MRRTAGVALGLFLVAAVVGITLPAAPPAGDTGGGNGSARPTTIGGRGEIGTVELVSRVLGYLRGERAQTFHSPDAPYVKVHVARARLLPGDYLTVADPTGTEVYKYDAAQLSSGRWTMSVTGDTAVVTLRPAHADPIG